MKKILLFSRLALVGLMLLFSSGWVKGQANIIISEVTDAAAYAAEYVEIYNAGDAAQDLIDWKLQQYGATQSTILSATVTTNMTGNYTLNPGEYAVICRGTLAEFQSTYSGYSGFYFTTNSSSSGAPQMNGGEYYELYNSSSVVVDYMGSPSSVSAASKTYERNDALSPGTVLATDWVVLANTAATPGAVNATAIANDNSAGGTPTITLTPTTLTGLSYEEGAGPSAEQSFTVSGADLTADISIVPPTNYEISTGTGGAFAAANPITLTHTAGVVAETTVYTRLKAGLALADYNAEEITAASTDATSKTVTCSGSVYNQVGWANVQWPANGSVARGQDFTVYAQVWEDGVTNLGSPGAGISAWIGYSTTDTDPSTWTNWIAASFNADAGNNDEYMANIGAAIAGPGTYYYASRFKQGSAPYYYGGFSGGEWDGTTNVSGVLTVTGSVSVIINEVDSDNAVTDDTEFVELYDGGTGNTALDGLVVVLYNGNGDISYYTFDLDGYTTDANGYFVIGSSLVANVDYSFGALTDIIQNGADAVALYYGNATDFPASTVVTTTNLIDAFVYDTDDPDDTGLLVLLNASEPQINENGGLAKDFQSSQRIANGTGGARNTSTYMQSTPTPGAINAMVTSWTGTIDGDFSNPSNWSNGLPTALYDVVIPADALNLPTISASIAVNSLTIEAGAELTIALGFTLTTNNPVVINSDALSSGSLINFGTIAIATKKSTNITPTNLIYNRYVTSGQWHLVSSPVFGQNIGSLLTAATNDIATLKPYLEATDVWGTAYTTAEATTLSPATGYALKRNTDGNIAFTGTQYSIAVNYPLTNDGYGWNLLGNPYSSAVKAITPLKSSSGSSGTSDLLNETNVAELEPSYAALYVWEEDIADPTNVNNYKYINSTEMGSSALTTHIQAGQAFFVKAALSGGTTGLFGINNTMQEHATAIELVKSEETAWPNIELIAETTNAKATTAITFNSAMTKGLDVRFDAGLLTSYPAFSLYTRLVEDNGVDFMLQALPEEYETTVVSIGLDAKAGEIVKFTAASVNIPEDYAVVLEDRATNTFTSLSDDGEYTVQLTADSDGVGRFFLRTSLKSTLGLGTLDLQNAFQVFTRPMESQLLVRGEATANTTARIYSITGKLVNVVNLKQAVENKVSFNENAGVYIVQISNENGIFTQKFSWVK